MSSTGCRCSQRPRPSHQLIHWWYANVRIVNDCMKNLLIIYCDVSDTSSLFGVKSLDCVQQRHDTEGEFL